MKSLGLAFFCFEFIFQLLHHKEPHKNERTKTSILEILIGAFVKTFQSSGYY